MESAVADPERSRTRPPRDWKQLARTTLARYGLLIAFALIVLAFSLARPEVFPTWRNWESILTIAAPSLIVASGLTVVLVMRDFDLSFASMIGLGGAAAVVSMVDFGLAWPIGILIAVGFGLLAGATNGFLVAYLGGNSFIITLAMGTVLIGVEYLLTNQDTIFGGLDQFYVDLGQRSWLLGLNNQIWFALIVAVLLWLLLDKTEIGRYMYAIGGNPEAARLSGVRTRMLRLIGFVVIALCGTLVGILLTALSASSVPNIGLSYLLPAFAGVFLGAAVFRPGEFNIPGTIVGVLLLGTVQTGLTLLNLETAVINLVQGAILITAVLVSRLGARAA